MSVEEESGELTPQEQEIYYGHLEAKLRQLVYSYILALKYIDGLNWKTVFIKQIRIPENQRENRNFIENQLAAASASKTLIIRFLVRWFAEAHIRSKLLAISQNRRLLFDRIIVSSDENSDSKEKFFSYLENLERYAQIFFHWGRIKSALLLIPVIFPFAIVILSLFLPSLKPYQDVTFPGLIGNLINAIISAIISTDTPQVIRVLKAMFSLFFVMIFMQLFFNEFGYKLKRAVFVGGLWWEKFVGKGEIEMAFLQGNPPRNIYHIEKEIFDLLGIKQKEMPFDLLLDPYIIAFIWMLAGYSYLYRLERVDSSGSILTSLEWIIAIISTVLIGLLALAMFFLNRRRLRNGIWSI